MYTTSLATSLVTGQCSGFTSLTQLMICAKYMYCVFDVKKCIKSVNNHVQNFNLGRYINLYTVRNYILRLPFIGASTKKKISDCISDDILPQIKILNTVFHLEYSYRILKGLVNNNSYLLLKNISTDIPGHCYAFFETLVSLFL